MSERIKMLGMFAILGFIAGVVANFTYHVVLPVIFAIFPQIFQIEWVLSGLAGACLTVFLVMAWAYTSKRSQVEQQ